MQRRNAFLHLYNQGKCKDILPANNSTYQCSTIALPSAVPTAVPCWALQNKIMRQHLCPLSLHCLPSLCSWDFPITSITSYFWPTVLHIVLLCREDCIQLTPACWQLCTQSVYWCVTVLKSLLLWIWGFNRPHWKCSIKGKTFCYWSKEYGPYWLLLFINIRSLVRRHKKETYRDKSYLDLVQTVMWWTYGKPILANLNSPATLKMM